MFFSCRVCKEKDARIKDLKEQVAYFKSQLFSPLDPERPLASQLEADGVLSGQQHVLDISADDIHAQTQYRQADEERSERDRLLSGTY